MGIIRQPAKAAIGKHEIWRGPRRRQAPWSMILERAYARIRDDQFRELSSEMNDLFAKMAANVVDDGSGGR